jgi:hypothetical protein
VLPKGAADISRHTLICHVLNTSIPAQYEENKARTLVHGAPFAYMKASNTRMAAPSAAMTENGLADAKKAPGRAGPFWSRQKASFVGSLLERGAENIA